MDAIVHEIGDCGRFQICHVTLTRVCHLVAVWGLYLMMFGSFEPSWICGGNLTSTSMHPAGANSSLGPSNASDSNNILAKAAKIFFSDCFLRAWHGHSNLKTQVGKSSGSIYLDRFPVNGTVVVHGSCDELHLHSCGQLLFDPQSSTIVSEFGLVCDKAWISSLLVFFEMLGLVCGCYISNQLGELIGVKSALYSNMALFAFSVGLAVLSRFWEMYAVFLFLIGFSVGGILSFDDFSLEFLNSQWRGAIRMLPMWSLSLSLFATVVFLLRDWRCIHLLTAALSGLIFFGVFWVSPSIRWLVLNDYIRKAENALWRMAKINNQPDPPRNDIVDSFLEELGKESNQAGRTSTFLRLCLNPETRFLTAKISYLCLSTSTCYLAMGFSIRSLPGDFYTNVIIACFTEIPPLLAILLLLKTFQNRWIIALYLSLSALACLISTLCCYLNYTNHQGLPVTIFVFLAKACTLTSWYAVSVSILHLYSDPVRDICLNIFAMSFMVGGLLAPVLIPLDHSRLGVSLAIMSVILFINIPVFLTLPKSETYAIATFSRDYENRD